MEGHLVIPRLKMRRDVSFIVDTGADSTLLMPLDVESMGVDYSRLEAKTMSVGIGGVSENFLEPALLAFREGRRYLHVYSLELEICKPSPDIMEIPSLLGRDILNRWRMIFDPSNDRLTFKVISADYTYAL